VKERTTLYHVPDEQVSKAPPFFNTGIDFAGPLYVKDPRANNEECKV